MPWGPRPKDCQISTGFAAFSIDATQVLAVQVSGIVIGLGAVRTRVPNVAEPIDEIPAPEPEIMAWRIYFIVGDILACATAGAASGWLTSTIVSGDWFALAAMAVGMIVGVIIGLLGAILFTPFFGSFEVMLPSSLSGMVSGMALGMIDIMAEIGWSQAVWGGGLIGLLCLMGTYVLNFSLRGEAN